ncbi:multidrug effflux MFS transporter [Nioella nitratireducens]|uniref:multidrug effflux MFS transporter n=1 Tax=Nioella nitratireducens TaxID=1287720 RepID=UPI0008FCF4DD|nr:multidrug effflux MFS transporter [Nioella nitratireducens]
MTHVSTAPADRRLSQGEFIALMGMMFATIAFSIDSMLPALPQIAGALTPDAPNLAQLVLTSFVVGMGVGTLFTGPLSDAFGRRTIIFGGATLYVTGALLAYLAPSLELILAARVLQGLGAAGPRIASMAMVRDLYSGRQMARIVSFAMLVFMIFPAIAPLIGAGIIHLFGWRAIFLAFVLFSAISIGWLGLRQSETLPAARRRPMQVASLWAGLKEVLRHPQVFLSTITQILIFGVLFGTISSVQQVFDLTYGRGQGFPLWFAGIAVCSALPPLVNASLVVRLGMRPLIRTALLAQLAVSATAGVIFLSLGSDAPAMFWVFLIWTAGQFAATGFTIGNLNALALEPMGHLAGMTASVMGAVATLGGAVLGAIIGQFYNGTPVPLVLSVLVCAAIGFAIATRLPREGK